MRRSLLSVLVLVTAMTALVAAPAVAHGDHEDTVGPNSGIDTDAPVILGSSPEGAPDWIFPVVGEDGVDFGYSDTFGACRGSGCSRRHHGVDIGTYGVKGVPVVAAADGVIRYVNWSWRADDLNPDRCCTLAITHADGWETWYIHLDNDTPGTDDGQGWGIAPGILPGVEVTAGQLVGWVGDSGNAEGTIPHLHWEVHYNDAVLNPTPHADAATRISAPIPAVWNGSFWDDEGNTHEANIEIIAELGITRGCNPPDNTMYCPGRDITRGEISAFIRRLLDLDPGDVDWFGDDDGTTFEDDINAVMSAGIGFGCSDDQYCANDPLRRDEMAQLLVNAFGYPAVEIDFFFDDGGSPFEPAINALAAAGVTRGCDPPDNTQYCPDRTLTRAEMATFFARALGLGT